MPDLGRPVQAVSMAVTNLVKVSLHIQAKNLRVKLLFNALHEFQDLFVAFNLFVILILFVASNLHLSFI